MLTAEYLRQKAIAFGFNFAGVIPAWPSPTLYAYVHWIEREMHGKMGYMARSDRVARREDLNVILPGVRSMILVGLDYRTLELPPDVLNDPTRGRIASYAWGLDYHDWLTPRLEEFAQWLSNEAGGLHKVYVDTGAILERSHAQQAGMGFVGKNTMLIHPRRGSYFFLGEILTTLEFDAYDTPHRETMCGSCTRCLNACPTDAFPKPYVLDARRCISYLTIENKGWIDRDLRPLMGNWVFGCDICQEVCPWQRFTQTTHVKAFYPADAERAVPTLKSLFALTDAGFKQQYANSPIYRIQRQRLVRNGCIAAGNSGHTPLVAELEQLLTDESPLVRGHASWALAKLAGKDARTILEKHLDMEQDEAVRAEIEQDLAQFCD